MKTTKANIFDSVTGGVITVQLNAIAEQIQIDITLQETDDFSTLTTRLNEADVQFLLNAIEQSMTQANQLLNLHDSESGDNLTILVYREKDDFTLVFSLRKNGDIQISVDLSGRQVLIDTLANAISLFSKGRA